LQCVKGFSQDLPSPEVKVESYIFKDSTLVSASTSHKEGSLMVEMGSGSELLFISYNKPFYVKQSKTIRFKLVHPDYDDSQVTLVTVHKASNLSAEVLGKKSNLTDLKRGGTQLQDHDWLKSNSEKNIIQFSTQNKKLQELELLSYVHSEKGILPPKKVVLYAHLKNGTKVHIRTANTIGKFKNKEFYWNHTLRLMGKPKLKKILRKTAYFSLEITPHFTDGQPQWIYIDEILVR